MDETVSLRLGEKKGIRASSARIAAGFPPTSEERSFLRAYCMRNSILASTDDGDFLTSFCCNAWIPSERKEPFALYLRMPIPYTIFVAARSFLPPSIPPYLQTVRTPWA